MNTLPDLEEKFCETCVEVQTYSSINATTSLIILTFTNNSRLIILHKAQAKFQCNSKIYNWERWVG
jgi:hypothetical protein